MKRAYIYCQEAVFLVIKMYVGCIVLGVTFVIAKVIALSVIKVLE